MLGDGEVLQQSNVELVQTAHSLCALAQVAQSVIRWCSKGVCVELALPGLLRDVPITNKKWTHRGVAIRTCQRSSDRVRRTALENRVARKLPAAHNRSGHASESPGRHQPNIAQCHPV